MSYDMKRCLWTLAAGLAVTLCAACSPMSGTSSGPAAIKSAQVAAEYRKEAKTLDLAPGWQWPRNPAPPTKASDGHDIVYQPGFGVVTADHYWYCTWEEEYLKPGLTREKSKSVYSVLKSVHHKALYEKGVASRDRAYFDKELRQAGAGDTLLMQKDVAVNCPKPT